MKILFIAPFPPPITGQSLASKVFLNELIKFNQVKEVNLSKNSLKNGIYSIARIVNVIKLLIDICYKQKDIDVVYFTISESIVGNIKDILIYVFNFKKLNKIIIHLHGGSLKKEIFDKNKLLYRINKYFIRRLGGAIVLGPSHVDIFSDIIDRNKIHIVPNFAEDYLFEDEDKIIDNFAKIMPLRILFLSNLIFGKGYNVLIDAYLNLNENLREKVIINFAGAFESEISKKKFLLKIDNIKGIQYHGIVGGVKKKELLSNAHIFCLPTSLNEGQPISILEAYATGCVVITTNRGGICDIFRDKINGFEVQEKSADSIKLIIEKIINNPKQLIPIAISNRKIASEKYSTSKFTSSLIRIIENTDFISKNKL